MAVYITGDTHREFKRFAPEHFREQERMTKEDIVLICGDFGGVWHGDERDDEGLDWLEKRPFTTAFIPGNHENYDALRKYPLEDWRGGKIRRIRPSVILLERGYVFDLCGKRYFAMGGGRTMDISGGVLEPDDPQLAEKVRQMATEGKNFRVNHLNWWKEELPGEEEYQQARASLDRVGWKVDYIITHCAPTSIQYRLLQGRCRTDALTEFLEEVWSRCRFDYWFFGHYHNNGIVEKRFVLIYDQVLELK